MQVVTIATKFERAQIHFTSDVFAADIAKNFWTLSPVWYRNQSQYLPLFL